MKREDAFNLCVTAHRGQTDKAGEIYALHPIIVMLSMRECNCTESQLVVALLHDVLEDTKLTIDSNELATLTDDEREALIAITRKPNENYIDVYIPRIAKNPIAKMVKLFDLQHNMNISRLKTVTPKDEKRIQKYKLAFAYLQCH